MSNRGLCVTYRSSRRWSVGDAAKSASDLNEPRLDRNQAKDQASRPLVEQNLVGDASDRDPERQPRAGHGGLGLRGFTLSGFGEEAVVPDFPSSRRSYRCRERP